MSKAPKLDLKSEDISGEKAKQLPEKIARKHTAIGFIGDESNIRLVLVDPGNMEAIDDAKMVTGKEVEVFTAPEEEIHYILDQIYGAPKKAGKPEPEHEDFGDFEGEGDDDEASLDDQLDIAGDDAAPVVKVVDLVLMDAMKKGASDIHIEPFENRVRVRYRIDGHLQEALTIPKSYHNALLARLKIISNLDITESRIPQDGRFKIKAGNREMDYRVSILPVYWGGKIVLRSLDKSNLKVGIDDLGFSSVSLDYFKKAIDKPFGMLIITGPTGSGKSTTLYSILNELNCIEKNLITVEDPIEYQVEGLTQVQARPEIGMTFSKALKAILRQSPDVVMIGEIRDQETADIAVKASLTGQIVLSTLHTNDAAGAVIRLRDMGIDSFLISSSLTLVAAQRLCRRLCDHCKVPYELSPEELVSLGFDSSVAKYIDKPNYHKPKGCAHCGNVGYKGRLAITETLYINDAIRELVERGASSDDIKHHAMKEGMLTLRTDALLKFALGQTSADEVVRVTSADM